MVGSVRHRCSGRLVATALLALIASGCAAATPSPTAGAASAASSSPTASGAATDAPSPAAEVAPLRPCSETPIPEPWLDEIAALPPAEPIVLTYDPATGRFAGDPAPLPASVVTHVDGAVVAIQDRWGTSLGSGFVVADESGPLVLTAAHVTGSRDYRDLRIVDLAGTRAGVVGGCYAFQDFGLPFGYEAMDSVKSLDVAVLVPEGSVGTSALEIGDRAPVGSWVFFDNFEGLFRPEYGRDLFTAVMDDPRPLGWSQYGTLTGIGSLAQPDDRHPPALPGVQDLRPETAMIGGASGGAVLGLDGRVVGMSVGSNLSDFLGAAELDVIGVTFEGIETGYATAVEPTQAIVVPPEGILAVIAAAADEVTAARAAGA